MRHITANTAQKDFDSVLDNVTQYNEPFTIVSDDNKVAVILRKHYTYTQFRAWLLQ